MNFFSIRALLVNTYMFFDASTFYYHNQRQNRTLYSIVASVELVYQ